MERKLEASSLASLAYQELLERIENCEFAEGERLVIDDLAREFGTSLIPVREALARLNAQRLVEYEKNKGYRVAPVPTVDEFLELFDARQMIETAAIRHGGKNVTPAHIKKLKSINDKIRKLKLGKTFSKFRVFVALNDEFHQVLVSIAGNSRIDTAYKDLAYGVQSARGLFGHGIKDLRENVREHDEIIAALESGNVSRMVKSVEGHIGAGESRFQAIIESKESNDKKRRAS